MNVEARLPVVDTLRGIAALAVCWYHLTNGNAGFLPEGWLKQSGSLGWLGVDVFFVISGFILPYSMCRRGYDLRHDAGRFIAKRILRLDPPYLVAVLMTLSLWYVSAALPGFRGSPPQITTAQVLAHVGYFNGVIGLPWLSPVFWSLAIEFQFYISIAFLFPLLVHPWPWVPAFGLAVVWGAAWLGLPTTLVFGYLGLFGCGLACFQYYRGELRWAAFLGVVVAMAVVTAVVLNPLSAAVSAATAVVIAWGRGGSALGSWFGKISYSLYLLHVPFGGRVINAGVRFADTTPLQVVVLGVALAVSIGAAYLFYRIIELPAQGWSAAVHYRGRARLESGTACASS